MKTEVNSSIDCIDSNCKSSTMKIKFTPPGLYKLFIVLMIISVFLPIPKQVFFPYNLAGIIPFLIGTYIAVDTKRMFKKTQTPMAPFAEPKILHTNGIFRFTRNPMYLSISIGLAGIAVLTGFIYNLSFPIIYIIIMDIYFVKPEERKLENQFGETFRKYKNTTRRWI